MTYENLVTKVRNENVLFTALLELTFRCNLDCFFCYNDLSMKGRAMRLDDYITLLDDLADMQVLTVTLSGGEPLAHPDFFEIGAAARERGFVVRVKSNGHALRGELARRLQNEIDPFIIEVSLHGATAATHDRQTRVPGSFDQLIPNLRGLREIGLRFKLNTTLTIWNENELEGMFEIADSLGVSLQIDPTVTPRDDGDREPLDISASPDALRRLVRIQRERSLASGSEAPGFERPVRDEGIPVSSDKHCGAGSMNVAVDPFGNVYPCVAWRVAAGNLHEQSIKEIWRTSAVLPAIRNATVDAKTMIDGEGELASFVGFCPGLAVHLTGRPDALHETQRARGEVMLDEHKAESTSPVDDPAGR